jgi:hypothetical protein
MAQFQRKWFTHQVASFVDFGRIYLVPVGDDGKPVSTIDSLVLGVDLEFLKSVNPGDTITLTISTEDANGHEK